MTVIENTSKSIPSSYLVDHDVLSSTGNVLSHTVITQNLAARVDTLYRDGVENPRHVEQIRKKQNATTPYERLERLHTFRPGEYELRWKNSIGSNRNYYKGVGQMIVGDPTTINAGISLLSTSSVRSRAHAIFIKRAMDEQRTMMSGVSLGELRETIHAIRHPLESLKNGMREYGLAVKHASRKAVSRKGKVRRPRLNLELIDSDLLQRGVLIPRKGGPKRQRASLPVVSHGRAIRDAISGTLLEYQNGWSPLVKDIVATSRTLAEHFVENGVYFVSISSKAKERVDLSNVIVPTSLDGCEFDAHHARKKFVECRYKGEVTVRHTGSPTDLMNSAGFTLKDFVPTIWQLLPLSYVADYFWNMSNVLDAYAFNWADVAWSSRSTKISSIIDVTGWRLRRPAGSSNTELVRGSLGSCRVVQNRYLRDFPGEWVPSLAFRLPGTGLIRKLANTSALLAQFHSTSRQISRLLNG